MYDFDNKTVLVVDDYATLTRIIRNLLIQLGFTPNNIEVALDGATALSKMKDKARNFIIADTSMEGTNGYDLLKATREDPAQQQTKFFLVCHEREKPRAFLAKPDGVLVKPFYASTLNTALQKVI